jgi:hypothetical protein
VLRIKFVHQKLPFTDLAALRVEEIKIRIKIVYRVKRTMCGHSWTTRVREESVFPRKHRGQSTTMGAQVLLPAEVENSANCKLVQKVDSPSLFCYA